jgi:hypothetical protein
MKNACLFCPPLFMSATGVEKGNFQVLDKHSGSATQPSNATQRFATFCLVILTCELGKGETEYQSVELELSVKTDSSDVPVF